MRGLRRFQRGPSSKLPTQAELCSSIGTTTSTLDGALRDLEAANVIYRKQGSGIFVSPKLHCKNIRVLINASLVDQIGASPFWGILWAKIVKEGQTRSAFNNEEIHFQLVACGPDITSLPANVVRIIKNGPLDGLICIGMTQTISVVPPQIPLVAFAGSGHWHVAVRHSVVVAEAVRRLSLLGCRNVGYWVTSGSIVQETRTTILANQTMQSFRSALYANGLSYQPSLNYIGSVPASESLRDEIVGGTPYISHQEEGYGAVMRAFSDSSPIRPDGLVIVNDMMTLGVLAALRQIGIRPGIDIQIASHSNPGSPVLYGWENQLLLWQVDPEEIVTAMFAILDRLMAGETPDKPVVYIEQRFPERFPE